MDLSWNDFVKHKVIHVKDFLIIQGYNHCSFYHASKISPLGVIRLHFSILSYSSISFCPFLKQIISGNILLLLSFVPPAVIIHRTILQYIFHMLTESIIFYNCPQILPYCQSISLFVNKKSFSRCL